MSEIDWLKNEYNNLRVEVARRAQLLHLFILVAVLFNLTILFMIFALVISGATSYELITFLLFVPIVFALLTFNYQANQMTLEGIAGYVSADLRKKLSKEDQKDFDGWDVFYGAYKKKYQLISFMKVVPLLLPMTLPIWLMLFYPNTIIYPLNILSYFDLALFAFIIYNFRYKIGK